MQNTIVHNHRWANRLQTVLLIAALLGICALAGQLLLGEDGIWMALIAAGLGLVITPAAAWRLTLSFYRARPISPRQAPVLWQLLETLAERAELPTVPQPYYVPSPIINAFAVGNRQQAVIALSDGLLQRLSTRELAGVLAHEMAHIANNDLRVMGLADAVSRITALFASAGQLFLLLSLPALFFGDVAFTVNWPGVILLLFSPHLAVLIQLGLSRTREYDADLRAATLTGDPLGLAQALAHIEQASRGWLSVLFPGWGNPEPSWLRTHPPTDERIRRLQALAPAAPWQIYAPIFAYPLQPVARLPRWRIGGLWH